MICEVYTAAAQSSEEGVMRGGFVSQKNAKQGQKVLNGEGLYGVIVEEWRVLLNVGTLIALRTLWRKAQFVVADLEAGEGVQVLARTSFWFVLEEWICPRLGVKLNLTSRARGFAFLWSRRLSIFNVLLTPCYLISNVLMRLRIFDSMAEASSKGLEGVFGEADSSPKTTTISLQPL
jgi:hypothetical protein